MAKSPSLPTVPAPSQVPLHEALAADRRARVEAATREYGEAVKAIESKHRVVAQVVETRVNGSLASIQIQFAPVSE